MRNPNRIKEVCNRLAAAWEKYPDWRLGQLLSNAEDRYRQENNTYFPLFYIEDEEMISYIEKYVNRV